MTKHGPLAMQQRMVESLRDPLCYPHPVSQVSIIETHISFVVLTGSFAYKIKKAVDLGFVDYSSLDRRRLFCAEELRLNRRLAPKLYLSVIAIGGTPEKPDLGAGDGIIEYAVRMAQFGQESLLDRVLASGRLTPEHIDALAESVALFHAGSPAAVPEQCYGRPGSVLAPVEANFAYLRSMAGADESRLGSLQAWSSAEFARLRASFVERKAAGFVRECHGDLHLGNMALIGGEPTVFDCIEFSSELRWIDVFNDLAFLVMDLAERGRPDYAWRLLNGWLECQGDYGGLALLRFYQVYRAMVRAKVAAIRTADDSLPAQEREAVLAAAARYLDYAEAVSVPSSVWFCLTHGLSGSGKSTLSKALSERLGAVRLRSDVERKRMHGMPSTSGSASGLADGLYAEVATAATYERLAELACNILSFGYPVIVDAASLSRRQRRHFRNLADEMGVPFVILACHAPPAILRRRIEERAHGGQDASEATFAILEHQIATAEPLSADESTLVVTVDTEADSLGDVLRQLRQGLELAT